MRKLAKTFVFLCAAATLSACMAPNGEVSRSATQAGTVSTSNPRVASATRGRAEQRMTAYLTGYSYWDNTPPGSAAISKPVIHRRAGGTGTYRDPITIAVGHTIERGRQTLDYPAGTRFYIERLRKYAIVEDVCGDGNRPQDGPCHTGHRGHPWLDIYVDGSKSDARTANACMNRITRVQNIIMNPRPDYPVEKGSLVASGCKVF